MEWKKPKTQKTKRLNNCLGWSKILEMCSIFSELINVLTVWKALVYKGFAHYLQQQQLHAHMNLMNQPTKTKK